MSGRFEPGFKEGAWLCFRGGQWVGVWVRGERLRERLAPRTAQGRVEQGSACLLLNIGSPPGVAPSNRFSPLVSVDS